MEKSTHKHAEDALNEGAKKIKKEAITKIKYKSLFI